VTGIRMPYVDVDGHVSGVQQGRAIYANNTGGPLYSLEIFNNTVTDFQKNGIDLRGNLDVNVQNNGITGNGWTPTTAQNGIVVLGGVTGGVYNNAVSEVGYLSGSDTSSGILSYTSNVSIHDNTVS